MLSARAARLDKKSKSKGLGVIPWMEIIPLILSLIASCKKPPTPAPPNPTPEPTPAQAEAWEKAWHLHSTAKEEWKGTGDDYRGPGFNRVARETKKKSRHDGSPISKKDAEGSTSLAFTEARTSTMKDLYQDIIEATHAL